MGILDNFESAWDEEFHFESKPIIDKNAIGEPIVKPETDQ